MRKLLEIIGLELVVGIMLFIFMSLILFGLTGCSVDHNADGKVETEATGKIEVVVEYKAEVCEDEEATIEQRTACIEALTTVEGNITVEAEEGNLKGLEDVLEGVTK